MYLAILLKHIFNLYTVKLAKLQRRFQGSVGVICMHVGFDQIRIGYYKHAVANRHEVVAILVNRGFRNLFFQVRDKILRAVLECDIFIVVLKAVKFLCGRAIKA